LPLIVEVENLTQLQQVLPLDGVERVLCDNFSIADLAQAVRLSNGKSTLDLVLAANGTQQQVLVFCKMLGVQCLMKMAHH
jgi:nicotinate-nucleotide pyrophosphorylase